MFAGILATMKFLVWGIAAALVFCSCTSGIKRGSDKALYTIAATLEVKREDIGKSIQLKRDQQLFFKLDQKGEEPGAWELLSYDHPPLFLLSETPRVEAGYWGLLLQARSSGAAAVKLRFTPADESHPAQEITFDISIRH